MTTTLPAPDSADGRDPKTGRFLPGYKGGPGRPRRPSGYTIATYKAAEAGVDLEAEVWAAIQALLEAAKKGDVAAARAVFAILLDDGADLRVQFEGSEGPREPEATELVGYLAQLTAAAANIEDAQANAAGGRRLADSAAPLGLAMPAAGGLSVDVPPTEPARSYRTPSESHTPQRLAPGGRR